jgi:hypothetical protein
MIIRRRAAFVLAVLVTAGCTSVVTVRPVTSASTPTGVRYSLPKPMLHVTPSADGTVTVEVVLLPDAEKTYAIDSFTVLAAHSLDVMVSRGLLQKVGAIGDSTAVTADLVRATGTVFGDVAKQQATAMETKESIVASAQTAVDGAESNLAAAEAKLATMVADGSQEVSGQRQTVAELRARRDSARDVLARERRRDVAVLPAAGSFSASTTGSGITLEKLEVGAAGVPVIVDKVIGGAGKKEVWGGKLYAIDEGIVGDPRKAIPAIALREVTFREVNTTPHQPAQRTFSTIALVATQVPKQDKTGEIVVALDDKNNGNIELKSNPPIAALGDPPFKLVPPSAVPPAVTLEAGGTTVRIDVSRMSAGTYRLTIPFRYDAGNQALEASDWVVTFRVLPPK